MTPEDDRQEQSLQSVGAHGAWVSLTLHWTRTCKIVTSQQNVKHHPQNHCVVHAVSYSPVQSKTPQASSWENLGGKYDGSVGSASTEERTLLGEKGTWGADDAGPESAAPAARCSSATWQVWAPQGQTSAPLLLPPLWQLAQRLKQQRIRRLKHKSAHVRVVGRYFL